MATKLDVKNEGKFSYSIYIEAGFGKLLEAVRTLDTKDRRALIVTDEHVAPLYLSEVKEILSEAFSFVDSLVLTSGEEHKNLDSIAKIYEKAVQNEFDRKDYFVALGGGVTGDMTGFAAATYMRGISFLQIPTTLLAQVDSSIGGKTGVDFRAYKNMVGAFHMPALVYSNVETLKTLDERQYASGMGEVIKHALIRNASYFDFLCKNTEKLKNRDLPVLMKTVYESNLIKRAVVEMDPTEKGERQLLNFGHTLGHAIEKCSNFYYSHGQCVAFGCIAAIALSNLRDPETVSKEQLDRILCLMDAVKLDTRVKRLAQREVLSATKKDKKMDRGQIRFILLHRLGQAYIDHTVSDDEMTKVLNDIMEN